MALGSIWLARPTAPRVLAVAVLFSLAWLMEWRLMFPSLPAMLVALWVCEPNWQRRLGWIALFLAGMVATAAVVAWAWVVRVPPHGMRAICKQKYLTRIVS
jgi:hypothetical protein